jgi:hypothetical protein
MTRYQLPDTPEDRRRAKRAPIVAALFAASVFIAALLFHPGFRTAIGENLQRGPLNAQPVAALLVPDAFPVPLSTQSPDVVDVRACVGNPECDPQYYEPGVR